MTHGESLVTAVQIVLSPWLLPWLPQFMLVCMIVFLVLNSIDALLLSFAIPQLWSYWRSPDAEYINALAGPESLPPVSIVNAVCNTGTKACDTARMLLSQQYSRYEVILVNDGSTDSTMNDLIREFDLYEVPPAFTVNTRTTTVRGYYRSRKHARLLCIDKEHGGDADALNAGINAARYPYALVVGAGVAIEPDVLSALTRPLMLNRNVSVVAPSVGVGNGARMENSRWVPQASRRLFIGVHTIEHLRHFVFARLGWNRLASNIVFPAAAALFKHEDLQAIGGFRTDSEAPRIDLGIRLYRYLTDRGIDPLFLVIPDAVAWQTLPETSLTLSTLRGERLRGTVRSLIENRTLFLNPEYGLTGTLVLPIVALTYVIAPFLELGSLIGLIIGSATGVLDAAFVWAYLAAVFGYGMLLSLWTIVLEALTFRRYPPRELARLALYAVAESFGYRQRLAWVRVRALFVDRSLRRPYGQHAFTKTA